MSLILLITTIIDLMSLEIFILRFSRDFNRQSINLCNKLSTEQRQ